MACSKVTQDTKAQSQLAKLSRGCLRPKPTFLCTPGDWGTLVLRQAPPREPEEGWLACFPQASLGLELDGLWRGWCGPGFQKHKPPTRPHLPSSPPPQPPARDSDLLPLPAHRYLPLPSVLSSPEGPFSTNPREGEGRVGESSGRPTFKALILFA